MSAIFTWRRSRGPKAYGTKSITQIRREEEATFVHWVPIGVQTNHKSSGNDGGNNADEHDKTPVIPLVAEPAHA